MSNKSELEVCKAELEAYKIKLESAIQARNYLERAFKRLLFAVNKQMEILGPILSSFKGKEGKKMKIGALPQLINKVMGMLDGNKALEIIEVAERDIYPMLTQYMAYYQQNPVPDGK